MNSDETMETYTIQSKRIKTIIVGKTIKIKQMIYQIIPKNLNEGWYYIRIDGVLALLW